MLELGFIFSFTILILIIFSSLGVIVNRPSTNLNWNGFYFLSFIILVLFIGTRDGVGVDFLSYKIDFQLQNSYTPETHEIGYIWIKNVLKYFQLNYNSFFLTISAITVILLFKSFKNSPYLIPIGLLMFFVGGLYSFVINGMKQGIAIMAFFNALRFIDPEGNPTIKIKNFFWFSFYIVLGSLFHYSILLFYPLILILNRKVLSFFNSLILTIIILIGPMIRTVNSIETLNIFSGYLISLFPKYKVYADLASRQRDFGHFGFGGILILLVNILPVILYDKIEIKFPNARKYFILYSIGTCLMYAFSEYMMIERILWYFSMCNVFVFAYIFRYLNKSSGKSYIFSFLNVFIFSFLFLRFIYDIPLFMQIQLSNNYSMWFIPLSK